MIMKPVLSRGKQYEQVSAAALVSAFCSSNVVFQIEAIIKFM